MVDVSNSTVIDRPVKEVFAYVTNVVNDPTWHTDVIDARQASHGPIGVGTGRRTSSGCSGPHPRHDLLACRPVDLEPDRFDVLIRQLGPLVRSLPSGVACLDVGEGVHERDLSALQFPSRRRRFQRTNTGEPVPKLWVDSRSWGRVA